MMSCIFRQQSLKCCWSAPSFFVSANNLWLPKHCCSNRDARALHLCVQSRQRRDQDNVMRVFDRQAKRMQRDRAAATEDVHLYDYLKEEVGYRLSDRIFDVKRRFEFVVDLGCGRGYASRHMTEDAVGKLYACDLSPGWLQQAQLPKLVPSEKMVVDEEQLPFEENSIDMVISCLSLHWVNDLPGTFKQINHCLKRDGVFLGAVFGGETLYELRCSLQLAELEREGGFSPHVSPFTDVRDLGALLTRAGFTLLTIDADEIVVSYPSMFELMWDLQGMGENNAAWNRKLHLNRDTMFAAAAIYKEMYGKEDGTVPATFQIFYMIGWKPDPSQPKPLPRGSGEVSLKDLHKVEEIVKDKKPKLD